MSTKWKYASLPADMRLERLRSGDEALYKEEIAKNIKKITNNED